MKVVLSLAALAVAFASCQKNLSRKETLRAATTVASDASMPLAYHSVYFVSDYPVVPGEVPPFRFTKTLYPDTRVKTINMLSRVNPVYPGYARRAVELIGTFAYSTNKATLTGTSEVWEYYKTPSGAGAKRSIAKKNVTLYFRFESTGFCSQVVAKGDPNSPNTEEQADHEVLEVSYNGTLDKIYLLYVPHTSGPSHLDALYYAKLDQYGNLIGWTFPEGGGNYAARTSYTYDYNTPRGSKNYSFIPSQNLISQEYSLLEVMQWLPQASHQRTSVSGSFFLQNGTLVTQSQAYQNYMFNAQGNETSVSYGDNVAQKTTWYPN